MYFFVSGDFYRHVDSSGVAAKLLICALLIELTALSCTSLQQGKTLLVGTWWPLNLYFSCLAMDWKLTLLAAEMPTKSGVAKG